MYEFRLPRILTTLAVAGIVVGLSACDDDDPTVVVRLTDGEIVAVAMALNDAEIETSKLADTRAKDEDVKEFARMMIQDHSALNEDLEDLGINPVENRLSRRIAETTDEIVDTLSNLSGDDFDLAYMEAQVLLHRNSLETLDETLIPEANDDDLRLLLEEMRDIVAAHLERAEEILDKLE